MLCTQHGLLHGPGEHLHPPLRLQRRAPRHPAGLGETAEELLDGLSDLPAADCDLLTLGQYLAPTLKHVPLARYLPPAEFATLAVLARSLGFRHVASGPFVRSRYHAGEMVHPGAGSHYPA